MSITLYYNAKCDVCARKAQRTSRLDWLNRVRISTDESPIGEVPRGEMVVVDETSQKVFTGIYATRTICMQVPLYYLYGLALYVPQIRKMVAKEDTGCNGDACEI